MIKNIELFHNEEELSELTGLDHESLISHKFDLDDINGGIRVKRDEELAEAKGDTIYTSNLYNRPKEDLDRTIERVLEDGMNRFCVGYAKVNYKDYIYYIIHHA